MLPTGFSPQPGTIISSNPADRIKDVKQATPPSRLLSSAARNNTNQGGRGAGGDDVGHHREHSSQNSKGETGNAAARYNGSHYMERGEDSVGVATDLTSLSREEYAGEGRERGEGDELIRPIVTHTRKSMNTKPTSSSPPASSRQQSSSVAATSMRDKEGREKRGGEGGRGTKRKGDVEGRAVEL